MEKTKLGIPAALLAAIACLLGHYSGYLITAILVGYVLLVEENAFLRRMVVKVLAMMFVFSLINTVIYLIPNIVSLVRSLIYVFDKYAYTEDFYNSWLNRFTDFLSSAMNLAKMVVFLLMGGLALFGKELKIPGLDKFLDKQLNKQTVA